MTTLLDDRPWPFGELERGAYSLVMIDPAWKFKTFSEKGLGKSADRHYRTMRIEDIKALPVRDLAAKDCLVWLWATAPMLNQQMDVLAAWGAKYVSSGVWIKTMEKSGKLSFGGGYSFRNAHEVIILGKYGSPKIASRSVRSVISAPRREHSRKPEEAYEAARKLIPYGRAADVFSRMTRPGWEASGDEVGKFDEVAA